jgi:hypothetical protein
LAFVLGIRNKDLLKITIINVLTNVPLNIIVSLLYLVLDNNIVFYLIVPILEVFVFLIEGTYFKRLKNSIIGPYKLSLFINIFSYGYSFVYLIINSILK